TIKVEEFLPSTRIDMPGAFSPDGVKLAFFSYLAGQSIPFWVAHRDGSGLRQLDALKAPLLQIGSWSPDGKLIAFDAALHGDSDIYVVSEEGGKPHRLTADAVTNAGPSWSQDGRWIYF